MIEYDEKGHLEKFKEPLIHVFNKNATVIKKVNKNCKMINPIAEWPILGCSFNEETSVVNGRQFG